MYIPKIWDYLKTLTNDEVKDFAVINFGEYLKSSKKTCVLNYVRNRILRKVVESIYIFLAGHDEIEKYVEMMQSNASDNCVHYYNIEILNLFD